MEAARVVRSSDEIATAIRAFTDADWARLRLVANKYVWLYPAGADDLLNEAVTRALSGARNCPPTVDVVKFLCDAMMSIAGDEPGKLENRAFHVTVIAPGAAVECAIDLKEAKPNAEESIVHAENCETIQRAILALFPDDPEARDLIEGIAAGFEGDELRELTNLNETAYASKRRFIRRTIDKNYPQGWKP